MKLTIKPSLNNLWETVRFQGCSEVKPGLIKLNFTLLAHNKIYASMLMNDPIKLSEFNKIRRMFGLDEVQSLAEVDIPSSEEMSEDWAEPWSVTREALIQENEKGYLNVKDMRDNSSITGASSTPY